MRVAAVILAAGSGTRLGLDKVILDLAGKPLWRHSFDTFSAHPLVQSVGLIASPANFDELSQAEGACFVALGGSTRSESSRTGVELADGDLVLLHDAARPFVTHDVISRVIAGLQDHLAVAAAIPVVDTIRWMSDFGPRTPPRHQLFAMQTPQGAHRLTLLAAYSEHRGEFTDEMALMETAGITPHLVEGDVANFKVTLPDDLVRARNFMGEREYRTGFGYDIHAFATDDRPLMLGGVGFEGPGLEGHSDADVVLHAATDALLGAAALGDIGQHFPNTDPRWQGEPSITFLRHASNLLRSSGWTIVNLDIAVMAEVPKIMPKSETIRETIASALDVEVHRVSIKATTHEGLGSIGRREGIAAMATATIRR